MILSYLIPWQGQDTILQLEMRKPRLREVKSLAQGHPAVAGGRAKRTLKDGIYRHALSGVRSV